MTPWMVNAWKFLYFKVLHFLSSISLVRPISVWYEKFLIRVPCSVREFRHTKPNCSHETTLRRIAATIGSATWSQRWNRINHKKIGRPAPSWSIRRMQDYKILRVRKWLRIVGNDGHIKKKKKNNRTFILRREKKK